jgi:hypothetical protein
LHLCEDKLRIVSEYATLPGGAARHTATTRIDCLVDKIDYGNIIATLRERLPSVVEQYRDRA